MSRSSIAAPREAVSRSPQAYETSSPTPADLRRYLRFSDEDARIWLDDQSMVMLHSSALGALRRELIEEIGLTIGAALPWREKLVDYPHALVNKNEQSQYQ